MKILVRWGSTRGGTEGIARLIAEALRERGVEVMAMRKAWPEGQDPPRGADENEALRGEPRSPGRAVEGR